VTVAQGRRDPSSDVTRRVEQLMGMPINLALRGRHARGDRADQAWDAVLAELRAVDQVFSTYRDDSAVSRLGRGEITLDECPPEVCEVLALGERARQESGGAFDVRRPGPGGERELDPSGVVKGWAVERAARLLEDLEETDSCLSAGGDMVCRSRSAGSPGWQIGVEDPADPSRVVAVIPLHDGAVATSGLAQRAGHLVDPRTGEVPTALASVTVIADDLTWADIDATAAFVLGQGARAWLEGRGRSGILVPRGGAAELFGYDRSS
jgi:thiamine biosynthesis lipoprotein